MMSSSLHPRISKLTPSRVKSPITAPTDSPPANLPKRPLITKVDTSSKMQVAKSPSKPYFLPFSKPANDQDDSRQISSDLYSIEKAPVSSRLIRTGSSKKITLIRATSPNLISSPKSLPFINISKSALNQSPMSPFEFHTQPDTSSPQIVTSRRDLDYSMQENSIVKNPHFTKFNGYMQAINSAELKKSPLSREVFYYPDQVQVNAKLAEKEKEMRKLESHSAQLTRTVKEGRKETVELSTGHKCYLRIDCLDKPFPLKVKVQLIIGSYEVCISKRHEKPDKVNCDYYFNVPNFEIQNLSGEEIRELYFGINGGSSLKLTITMNFSHVISEPRKSVDMSRKSIVRALSPKHSVYEFYSQNMTYEDRQELDSLVAEIKKERHLKDSRNIIINNNNIASNYQNVLQERRSSQAEKREFGFIKNRENKMRLASDKKKRQVCNAFRLDLFRMERDHKNRQEIERHETTEFQTGWLRSLAIINLLRNILERKRMVHALRILQSIKSMTAAKIQRKYRAHLARPIYVKVKRLGGKDQPCELNGMEALTGVNISQALNAMALMSMNIQRQAAERLIIKSVLELKPPSDLSESFDTFTNKVKFVQKKWRHYRQIMQARIGVFSQYWEMYCQELVEDSNMKKKVIGVLAKVKRSHVKRFAADFIRGKLHDYHKKVQAVLAIQATKPKAPMIPLVPSSKGSLFEISDATPKTGRSAALYGSKKDASGKGGNRTARQKLISLDSKIRYIPNRQEFKKIFEAIAREVQFDI